MKILIWVAEHSVWISCVALFVVIPLKLEHWLPKQVKKYLLIIDIFIAVSTPLLGVLKENLDEHWKSQLKKQSEIHDNEIAALKRDNKNIHLSFSSATTNSEAANKELQNKLNKAEKGIAKLIKIDSRTPARNVKLPASGKFTYVKTDNSANTVKITTSIPGQTLLGGLDSYELSVQGESVTLEFSGSNWFKIY